MYEKIFGQKIHFSQVPVRVGRGSLASPHAADPGHLVDKASFQKDIMVAALIFVITMVQRTEQFAVPKRVVLTERTLHGLHFRGRIKQRTSNYAIVNYPPSRKQTRLANSGRHRSVISPRDASIGLQAFWVSDIQSILSVSPILLYLSHSLTLTTRTVFEARNYFVCGLKNNNTNNHHLDLS